MPNRYMPSALAELVAEEHESLLQGKDEDDDYVAEWEVLVQMLRPEYREEYERRAGESHE